VRIEGAGGKIWIVYTDLDRLEEHMKELAPGDAGVIEELCNAARVFATSKMSPEKRRELRANTDGDVRGESRLGKGEDLEYY